MKGISMKCPSRYFTQSLESQSAELPNLDLILVVDVAEERVRTQFSQPAQDSD